MIYYLANRESISDAINAYNNNAVYYPHPGVRHRRISGIPLHNNTYASYGNNYNYLIYQPFVLHTTDEYAEATVGANNYHPSHAVAFRTIDQTEINTSSAPFANSHSSGGGKLGIYSYWNTEGPSNLPIQGINSSQAPNEYEFYNYSPSWGNANPQEIGNQFGTSPSAPPSSIASAHFNDFFNTGNNSGINIQNELYQLYMQGSNSNTIQQVQTAINTAFDNYIIYLQHTYNMTGSNGLIDPNNNSTSGPPYYTW